MGFDDLFQLVCPEDLLLQPTFRNPREELVGARAEFASVGDIMVEARAGEIERPAEQEFARIRIAFTAAALEASM
jgi:hypothetical protein